MIVVVLDASVLVAAAIDDSPEGRWADELVTADQLAAPHLALVEATNILRRLEQSARVPADQADAARRDLVRLDLELFPFEPFADRIWELRHNLTSYDAWYVAVAEAIAAPVATLDRRLAGSTGPRCGFLTPD